MTVTSTTPAIVPPSPFPIVLTPRAAQMVQQAMADEKLVNHSLRVGVVGGGCSGLQYLLDFSENHVEDDLAHAQHEVEVIIDPFSAAHLQGTTIDYVEGLQGNGFKFENPNVVRACGCGSSFQT